MHRNGQHPVVVEEGVLHSVAVVGVNIYVHHPHAPAKKVMDGQGRVVEHAETRGMARSRMVQPAGYVESNVDGTASDHFRSQEGGAGAQRCRLIHSCVIRIVSL